ncbi:MAG: hypothetical protein RLZZ444_1833, partial [Pseudomonadota bacterium]
MEPLRRQTPGAAPADAAGLPERFEPVPPESSRAA